MYLIDGYNLLHAVAPGRATPESRERLIAAIEAWCRRENYRAVIVFDPTGGMRRREDRGPLEVRVVAEGRKADDEILGFLRSTADRTAYTVVSDDRGITDEAARGGFKAIPCREFARGLAAPPGPGPHREPGSLPTGEVDSWLREFGYDPDQEP